MKNIRGNIAAKYRLLEKERKKLEKHSDTNLKSIVMSKIHKCSGPV